MPKKEIYQKDPEKWKKKNKESYDPSYHAEYRKKNRERINAMRRERYKNNPDYDKHKCITLMCKSILVYCRAFICGVGVFICSI